MNRANVSDGKDLWLSASGATRAPRLIFGNYEVLSPIGKGGTAEVYLARILEGPRVGWAAVLKRLIPVFAQHVHHRIQFEKEAHLSSLLQNSNIISIYEYGVIHKTAYIAMELVDGRDVAHILRQCRQRKILLPVDFAVFLVKTLLDALHYAHTFSAGSIVHCDVSPSNLFISRTGDIKLGDFGVATIVRSSHFQTGLVAGKIHYLSPEMLEQQVSPAADLWAAAIMLFELLTLERPFDGADDNEIVARISKGKFVPSRKLRTDVSGELDAVVRKALSKKESQRFQTAAEFSNALVPLFDDRIGTPLAIAAVVRGLFGVQDAH